MLKIINVNFYYCVGGKFVPIKPMHEFSLKLRIERMLLTPLEPINGFL